MSIIKLSQLEAILNYALQFRLQRKSNKFCRRWRHAYQTDYIFGIGIASIYRWLSRPKLSATKVKSRQIKLDWKELEKDVKQNPESIIVRQS